ncbi:MAG: 1-(5-phosphoribosyl)-5-[(5-phosphoribosylamino)methylideneamino] imidazole-4-carboxamide isomerase [Gemmatimonadetes bacterium]|nr:1-(5-phosphoribosyl)-5-[(5-phosphoribosylamino)methylideneamino] imidazole-4-carboxamide isomerase [Gemmatimonadota bacterium]
MIALPAVDLREGRCVQLVGGRPDAEKVRLDNPSMVALRWFELGFRHLHVVDLDAAMGTGDNGGLVGEVIAGTAAESQVGGGVRTDERADALFAIGAQRIVVGTRAVDDPAWLARLAGRYPGRVIVAADVRDGVVLRKGWTESSKLEVGAFLANLAGLPLAAVLCTDVEREGLMQGIDLAEMRAVIDAAPHKVLVSGGITSMDDLAALADAGAYGAVLGMALYTGRLQAEAVARTYGGN